MATELTRRGFIGALLGTAVAAATAPLAKVKAVIPGLVEAGSLFGISATTYEAWRSGAVGKRTLDDLEWELTERRGVVINDGHWPTTYSGAFP